MSYSHLKNPTTPIMRTFSNIITFSILIKDNKPVVVKVNMGWYLYVFVLHFFSGYLLPNFRDSVIICF